MDLRAGLTLELVPRLEMRASPELVLSTQFLAMSGMELRATIDEELAENPALESDDLTTCAKCADPRCRGTCCDPLMAFEWAELRRASRACHDHDASNEPPERPCGSSPPERLLADVRLLLDRCNWPIADFVVGSLDEHGLLDVGVNDIAVSLGVDTTRVNDVLCSIREVGPPGIAATSAREGLLLQLDRLEPHVAVPPIVRPILVHHLEALAAGRYDSIAQALGTSVTEVVEAKTFIRTHLRPHPVSDFVTRDHSIRLSDVVPLTPDVVIRAPAVPGGPFEVEVLEASRFRVRVSEGFCRMARHAEGSFVARRDDDASKAPREGAEEFMRCLERARAFVSRLTQRWETMRRVAEFLCQSQRDFLVGGPLFLVPLTLAEVAEALGVHESTVSRATSNKFVLIPRGQVVPFRLFFEGARRVHELIRRIVASEPVPLSDDAIARALRGYGIDVARRTVAKYRTQIGIPPRHLRGGRQHASGEGSAPIGDASLAPL